MSRSDTKGRDYLTRNLFNYVSLLSPVQEEEESFDSPRRPQTRSTPFPPARPESPLPPLIIEVEKRVNKHDHPEEFYVKLEKKLKRIYRRLFIDGRNISSPMSTDDENEYTNDNNRSEEKSSGNLDINEGTDDDGGNKEPEEITDRKRKTSSQNESSQSDEEEIKQKKSKTDDSSSEDFLPKSSSEREFDDGTIASSIAEEDSFETDNAIEDTQFAKVDIDSHVEEERIDDSYNVHKDDVDQTSESLDYIQVTFKADVHRAYSEEANDDLLPPVNADETIQDPEAEEEETEDSLENNGVPGNDVSTASDRGDDMTDDTDAEPADEEIGEPLEKGEVPGNNASTASDRGDDITTPRIQPDDVEPADEEIGEPLENNRVPYNLLPPALDREVELMRSPLIRPSVGSLPEYREYSNNEEQIDFEFLNRTQDENADDEEIEVRDVGTETSFEENYNPEGWGNSREGWGNIFIGQPRVLKLCSCTNHVCE